MKKKATLLKATLLISILLISIIFVFLYFGKDKIAEHAISYEISKENMHQSERSTINFRYNSSHVKEVPFSDQLINDVIKMSVLWFPSIESSQKPEVYLLTAESKIFNSLSEGMIVYGNYFPDINKIYINTESKENLDLVFIHEYGHYVLNQYLKDNNIDYNLIPDWFHEAIASLFEWDVMNMLPHNITSFQATEFDKLNYEDLSQLNAQGFYAAVDLRNNIGEDFLLKITEGLQEGNSFEKVLENFNVNLDTYHNKFFTNLETIANLDSLLIENPQAFIAQVQILEENLSYPNQYSSTTSYSMMRAYLSLGDLDNTYLYAKKAAQVKFNPLELIQIYKVLVDFDQDLADAVLKRAYDLADKEGYDLESIKKYME